MRGSVRPVLIFAVATLAVSIAPPAVATPTPARVGPGVTATNIDHCLDQCREILPPGQNGTADLAEILAFQATGLRPAHAADQLKQYESLVWNPDVTEGELENHFVRSSFGMPALGVESTQSPRSDVTIYRERATGIPHVRGTTRSGTIFGAGYAGAEDRLFVMDVLRHVGRGELTPFAGGAPGNRAFEQDQWLNAPYTEADLQRQFDQLDNLYGDAGVRLQQDLRSYVDGVNAYISAAKGLREKIPGEYVLLGKSLDPWRVTDVIATAGLVGGIFGKGGGGEVASALALIEARLKYGLGQGQQVWEAFRAQNDPEAPTTVHDGRSFPYGQAAVDAPGRVLPDAGSVVAQPIVTDPAGDAAARAPAARAAAARSPIAGLPTGMSNALVVSGAKSASGRPLAVFGPQTGYFAPQLLLQQDLQGPGISAHGAAFAGVNFYVLLGRGRDYSWSATSAGQDITDTFAVDLCNADGSPATLQSQSYVFRGQCRPLEVISKRNSWTPSVADQTPAGAYTLVAQRTKLGLVSHRGTVGGRPVAFTRLRSTYMHEMDSGIGFSKFNDPDQIRSAADFQAATAKIGYTFNWFYLDRDDIAYFNSGNNPVRAPGADPNLPTLGTQQYEWQGWNPATAVAAYTPAAQHPQGVNQDYYTSWNNKQAPGYSAADNQYGYSAVYRSEPLDDRIKAATAGGRKMSKVELVRAMQDAATVDLRGDQVLPLALDVIGTASTGDAGLDASLAALRQWVASGAHRIVRGGPPAAGAGYDEAKAVQLMDAWWPLWIAAEFKPKLGTPLYDRIVTLLPVDDRPGHIGSAFQQGWWGYANKDLRAVLGQPVAGGPTGYCGAGNRAACRQVLLDTLKQAAAVPATSVYPADEHCAAGDQYCHDSVIHQAIGGVTQDKMHWTNRPTYQQVVEFPARRGDNITNLAAGRPAKASSTFIGFSPTSTVDADQGTRWASSLIGANQWVSVDLGVTVPVARSVVTWDSAYAADFAIQVSTNGTTWREVARVTGGNGGVDNLTFPTAQARYVRLQGIRPATLGYSIREISVYGR